MNDCFSSLCTSCVILWQEALHREQMLEQKLATLQRLLANTQEASESSWQVGSITLVTSSVMEALRSEAVQSITV